MTFNPGPSTNLLAEIDGLLRRLFPICRSLTGDGVRETLRVLQDVAHFDVKEIPSGTVCYDWTVPDEWNVNDGFIADSSGRRIIDFQKNNVHLVNYSSSINRTMSFRELEPHLHTLPDLPEAIPYRTSYYNRSWGFCLSYNQFRSLDQHESYHVLIDAELKRGSLTFGEGLIEGTSGQEYLISTYCCHPSLANDNLSGQILWAMLYRSLKSRHNYHSYRFVIAPETIGAIAYLAHNQEAMRRVAGGFVITTVAGPGPFGYKSTYLGDHLIDKLVQETFRELSLDHLTYEFDLAGSDERQYSSPYFRIPIGTISKDKYQEYDYYHTSLDNLDFVKADYLLETLRLYERVIERLEMNRCYRSLNPFCEPMLGKRNLYPKVGGHIRQPAAALSKRHEDREYAVKEERVIQGNELDALLWTMFYSDGKTSLLEVAQKTGLPMTTLYAAAERLVEHGLLEPNPPWADGKAPRP